MLTTTREKLEQSERRVRELNEQKKSAVKVREAARAALAEIPNADREGSPQYAAAKQAVEAARQVDDLLAAATEERTELLRSIGDSETGRAGFASPGINGFDEAARRLSLSAGELRVDVQAQTLLQPSVPPPTPTTPTASTVPGPVSRQWLYPVFGALPFGSSGGDMAVSDFEVSFVGAELTGLGGVEREPDAVTGKTELNPAVSLATVEAKQYAAVVDDLPAKVFDNFEALRSVLNLELGRQLSKAYDDAVTAAIEAKAPPSGSTGADLLAKIRNAIASMREFGGEPSVVALTPTDAASLDLLTDAGGYVMNVQVEGSGSPVWTLSIRETPSIAAPTLVDVGRLGVSYTGAGTVLVDPYTGLKTNQTRVRAEIEARFHVRNILQGARVIA